MRWDERASANLLPLSRATTLAAALREWGYTGSCEDYGRPFETCQLCDNRELRYHFEIRNRHTERVLLVGSECITRFGIEGDEEARRDRTAMIRGARRREALDVLECLARLTDGRFEFRPYFEEHEALTPRQMVTAIGICRRRGVPVRALPPVRLRRERDRGALAALSAPEREILWPFLSAAQRRTWSSLNPSVGAPIADVLDEA